jgi:hypothetical protein
MTPNKSNDSIKELTAMVNELVKNSKKIEPPKFPMKFKECLRRVIGGRLHGNRLHIFRNYWSVQLKKYEAMDYAESVGIKTDEGRLNMANEMIEKYTREGVGRDSFNQLLNGIPKWRKENQIQQRRDAAKKRWKNKSKKSLGGE